MFIFQASRRGTKSRVCDHVHNYNSTANNPNNCINNNNNFETNCSINNSHSQNDYRESKRL